MKNHYIRYLRNGLFHQTSILRWLFQVPGFCSVATASQASWELYFCVRMSLKKQLIGPWTILQHPSPREKCPRPTGGFWVGLGRLVGCYRYTCAPMENWWKLTPGPWACRVEIHTIHGLEIRLTWRSPPFRCIKPLVNHGKFTSNLNWLYFAGFLPTINSITTLILETHPGPSMS